MRYNYLDYLHCSHSPLSYSQRFGSYTLQPTSDDILSTMPFREYDNKNRETSQDNRNSVNNNNTTSGPRDKRP